MEGSNLHLVHTKLSELLAFRPHRRPSPRRAGAGVYFVHGLGEGRGGDG